MLKKIVNQIIIVFVIFCLASTIFTPLNANESDETQTLIQTIFLEDFSLISTDDGDEIQVENYGKLLVEGKPLVPSKIVSYAIPPNAKILDISAQIDTINTIPRPVEIIPTPSPIIIDGENNEDDSTFTKNYNDVYQSDDPYPANIIEFMGTSQYRKYELVDIRVNPFTYYPLSKQLDYYPEITIQIEYELTEKNDVIIDNLKRTEDTAEEIIDNYQQAQQWYPQTKQKDTGQYSYVIITLDSLTSSVIPLVNWEISKGETVNVTTTSWIYLNYAGYDNGEKIRNFLRDKYPSSEWGIENVLLVGSYSDVPIRFTAQPAETDYYYAELSQPDSQSWDIDGDHQYGESSDPIDFYAEVNVGRIPFSTPTTVYDICDKSVDYEQTNDPTFKKNILLLGAYFWDDTDNAVLMEAISSNPWMSDWTKTRMYEQGHSSYSSDYDLNIGNVNSVWPSNTYAYVDWAGHGSPTSAHIMYSKGSAFVNTGTCSYLNDDYPAIIFADACSNHETEQFNIGQGMMQQGGVGFLGSTEIAYGMHAWNGPYDGSSQSLDYFFTSYVTSGDYTQGEAHQKALREMYTNSLWYYTYLETFEWGSFLGNPNLKMFYDPIELEVISSLPEYIDPGVPTHFEIRINEISDTYINGTGQLHYRFDTGSFHTISISHLSGDVYEVTMPAADCGDTPEYYFSIQGTSTGPITNPDGAPTSVYSCLVGNITIVFSDDFETDTGWSVVDDGGLTAGSWERGIPIGGGDRGDPAIDYDGSGRCYLTQNDDGDSDIDGGITWLISPTLALANMNDPEVTYAYWYTNNFGSDPNNDLFIVYVSNDNGATWEQVDVIGPASSSGWKIGSFHVSDYVLLTDQIKVRFEASDLNSGSVVEAGIDAFTIQEFNCIPLGNVPLSEISQNWNLFSIPFNTTVSKSDIIVQIYSIQYTWNEAVLEGYISEYVFGWDRTAQYYTFTDQFIPGEGYWFYANVDCQLYAYNVSTHFDDYITVVSDNWNMMSVPDNENLSKTDVIVDGFTWDEAVTNSLVSDFIFGWNPSSQSYVFSETFEPGNAYWLYAYQPCMLKREI